MRPPQCDALVFTYHNRGTHRCYRRAKVVMDGLRLCPVHAAVQARRHTIRAGREMAVAS